MIHFVVIPYIQKVQGEKQLLNQYALRIFDDPASYMSVRILEENINNNINEFTGNDVDCTIQEQEEMQQFNVSYLTYHIYLMIDSQAITQKTNALNQPSNVRAVEQPAEILVQPSTS